MALDEGSFRAAGGRRYRSRIADIFTALDESDSQVLTRVLADRAINAEAIARTLTKEGHHCSPNAVRYYRRTVLGWQD
jgi:hypothetical protein